MMLKINYSTRVKKGLKLAVKRGFPMLISNQGRSCQDECYLVQM